MCQKIKHKPKRSPKRPIWQVILGVVVVLIFSLAGWQVYTQLNATPDGADIIFLRDDFNFVSNIYTLDVDDPNAEPVALTDYTPNNSERIDSFAYPDQAEWVLFVELNDNDAVIKQIDLASGEISTIFECDTERLEGCWSLDVSPSGRYMVFGGLAKDLPAAEVAWIIDLNDENAEPILIEDVGVAPAKFINDDVLGYWSYERDGVVLYDIATGDITETGATAYYVRFSLSGAILEQSPAEFRDGVATYNTVVINALDGTEETFTTTFGDLKAPYSAWHPDDTQFLTRAYNFDADPEYTQIALVNAETGDGELLVDDKGFSIIGFEWSPDGEQFVFWNQRATEWGSEGNIWIYDMQSRQATPLNHVGAFVGWLN